MKKILMILMFGIILVGVCSAEMKNYKGTEGRSNHSDLYNDSCNSCHSDKNGRDVTDKACVECHGPVGEIAIDPTHLAVPLANPHKSVHYGNAVSCLACHSEHKMKAPICADCHRTWFKSM